MLLFLYLAVMAAISVSGPLVFSCIESAFTQRDSITNYETASRALRVSSKKGKVGMCTQNLPSRERKLSLLPFLLLQEAAKTRKLKQHKSFLSYLRGREDGGDNTGKLNDSVERTVGQLQVPVCRRGEEKKNLPASFPLRILCWYLPRPMRGFNAVMTGRPSTLKHFYMTSLYSEA